MLSRISQAIMLAAIAIPAHAATIVLSTGYSLPESITLVPPARGLLFPDSSRLLIADSATGSILQTGVADFTVPEPGTMTLLLAGLIPVLARFRRSRTR